MNNIKYSSFIIVIILLLFSIDTNGQTIHFDPNGGSGTMSDIPSGGASITLPQCTFGAFNPGTDVISKHTFYKWNTEADGSGTDYAAGEEVMFSSNVTLYAQWYIFLDLEAGDISFSKDSGNEKFSGAVFVNGAVKTFSGRHFDNSRYYIYQSCSNSSSPNYHIGYSTIDDFNNRVNVCVPVYPSIKWNGDNWGDFISNNSDIPSVLDNWPTAAENSGRTPATDKRITINAGANDAEFNIVIADLWSSYEHNVTHSTIAAITIGGIGSTSSTNHEKVTLKVKGDNRFYNILYAQKVGLKGYLKVTSISGDGSENGSLTLGPSKSSVNMAGSTTVFGSADDQDSAPCFGLEFNGSTIFASDTKAISTDAHCVIGGGSNNDGYITITGGRVTAVANGTSAAIGGGGGFTGNGGNGYVNISGGKVYAYHFGAWSSSGSLTCSAIGGGNSFDSIGNTGTVSITGGEVYAQSIGGVAIGGGSSRTKSGGSADVSLIGGTIIAKSIPGIINGTDVPAGAGIGGGTGNSNGGNATLNVSGGILRTGSVGGGGSHSSGGKLGNADITISGGDIQGQFVMEKGSSSSCSFLMTNGTIHNTNVLEGNSSNNFYYLKNNGGALWIDDINGTVNISGGEIKDCTAQNGGAIYQNGGTLTFDGEASIHNNTAIQNGGAVFISGGTVDFITNSVDIKSNEAIHGGGLFVSGGDVTFKGNIEYNTATRNGGGAYVTGGTVSFNGNIHNNNAKNGGGLYLAGGAKMTFTGGIIAANEAMNTDEEISNTAYWGRDKSLPVEGCGGGIYLEDGSSKRDTTILSFSFPAGEQTFGLYGNTASKAGQEIIAEGYYTRIKLPLISNMKLAGFEGQDANPNWYQDYFDEDDGYEYSHAVSGNVDHVYRYKKILSEYGNEVVQHLILDDKDFLNSIKNKYLCITLGFSMLDLTVRASGLLGGETALVKLTRYGSSGQKTYDVMLKKGENETTASKTLLNMPWGTYTIEPNNNWNWHYEPISPMTNIRIGDAATAVIDLEYKHKSVAEQPLHYDVHD